MALYGQVLNLLGGEQAGSAAIYTEKTKKADTTTVVPMPDLIDTGDPDAYQENFTNSQSVQNITNLSTPPPLIDDLFGDGPGTGVSASESKNDDDPFADVSFHASDSVQHADDLFSGMIVDDNRVLMKIIWQRRKMDLNYLIFLGPIMNFLRSKKLIKKILTI